MTTTSAKTDYRLLIGGEWVAGTDGAYGVVNPATEEIVAEAPEAGVADVDAARSREQASSPAGKVAH